MVYMRKKKLFKMNNKCQMVAQKPDRSKRSTYKSAIGFLN